MSEAPQIRSGMAFGVGNKSAFRKDEVLGLGLARQRDVRWQGGPRSISEFSWTSLFGTERHCDVSDGDCRGWPSYSIISEEVFRPAFDRKMLAMLRATLSEV